MTQFQHGLFGCFDNCTVCVITYFCPCYTQGKISEKVGESCLFHTLLFFVPVVNLVCAMIIRGKVRENRGIEGSVVSDCLAIWCCPWCALCQEANEVDALGSRSMAMSMARE